MASYSFLVIAVVIVAEGSLSYLGVGVPPPQPSWGGMIADGQRKLKTDPHLVFVPATVMFLTVLSFNRIGEWARTAVPAARRAKAAKPRPTTVPEPRWGSGTVGVEATR